MSNPKPKPEPTEPPPVSEADYERARELVSGYVDEYHQTIFWYLVRSCGAPVKIAEEVMQELWLHSMQQLALRGREQMYKTYLFWKARNICFDIYRRNNRYVPFGGSPYAMLPEDEAEEKNDAAINEMVTEQYKADQSSPDFVADSRHPEPLSEEAESELFQRFWNLYPDIKLSQEQKEIAFELFRKGHTLKEISEKRGIPISTLSDWKQLIVARVESAHQELDKMEANK